ncbi:zinc finger protein 182-like isoform X11 [Vanessa tameamea]|uniref:Zinc finger protein 182-like isoform X11 n=1 Tax=Vanessa tameamea TaxID=334116 RepID=A0ABM4AXE5_VANTA
MEFDEIVVKESPGLCRCCLSEGCYKDLGTEYTWMDETEVYADILLECFDISISQHMEGPNGPNRLICEVCITRLRDACNFKKQVLDSEKKFVDMVGRGEFKSKVIVYQEQMKSEMIVEPQPAHDADVEYLDEEIDYDDGNKDDSNEPTVSEDITVDALPIKGKRGRPKKSTVKPEKKKSKLEEKTKPKIVKEQKVIDRLTERDRKCHITRLITVVIEYSTIIPFRWFSNKFMCFYCCCSFIDSSKLKLHTQEEHNEVKLTNVLRNITATTRFKLDISEISCKKCPKPVQTLDEFLYHVSNIHDIKFNKTVTDCLFAFKLSDDGMFCLDCGQNFRFFGTLLTHAHKFHVKTSTFLCETCGQGFVAKANLDSHVKTVHSNYQWDKGKFVRLRDNDHTKSNKPQKLQCPKCPEILRSNYLRKQHLALVHDVKSSQFSCDICSKIFLIKSKLIQHKSRVHLKEKSITCEICGFKVFSKDLLKRHMVKHDDSRPFQCEICKKAFQRKKTLDFHRRIHTNDRRYVCKDCGKAFVQVTSLKLHLRVHHNNGNI